MKAKLIALAFALVALESFTFDFRNTSWFMSQEQVVASESDTQYTESDSEDGIHTVMYDVQVEESYGFLAYYFMDGKLVAGQYLLFGTEEEVAKIFEESVDFLKTKYGKPNDITESEANWYLERTRISLWLFATKFNGWFLERNYANKKENEFMGEAP